MADKTLFAVREKSGRRKNTHKPCPICKQDLVSDASKPLSCALCGMVIDSQNMFLWIEDSEEKYFCLHGCYERYTLINNPRGTKGDL